MKSPYVTFRRSDLTAVAFVLIVTCVSFWNVLADPLRAIQQDLSFQWEGMHAVANEQISEGCFPHWNPYGLGGERLFANIQLGLLYPGSILFRLLPFGPACVWSWIIHYIATALTTYILARLMLKVHPIAAALAGLVFALGGLLGDNYNSLLTTIKTPC